MSDTSKLPAESNGADPSAIPGLPADWPHQATTAIVDKVDMVRTKTAGPAIGISRKVVYGFLAGLLGLVALIIIIGLLFRLLVEITGERVWLAYMILGGLFVVVGVICWAQRPRGAAKT